MKAKRLLVVDCDPSIIEMIQTMVSMLGDADTIAALDATEAVRLAALYRPALIVAQEEPQCIDFRWLVQTLKRVQPTAQIPIVALVDDDEAGRRALRYGAREYIVRPFVIDRLAEAVVRYLDQDIAA